ncbi:alpha-ketoglutarate-dependent dioxygenase AlkB [Iamia sp. SCSIO 61187]|uniref:alpha-ketoglutarate-dependent dioxygenase AlkB n=1 Tax=Iamia sp. SCSIO 61187 TaxID=2722752 RepID=UPI001C62905E|nr:alpha-ketoglutarate-dependent dioxygenase AlkB [Iamia sp. SCSIO 61187]QYG95114.1 alpha-ketoglutarate-dependent dioxygenase AlkB [Iamia sp. SCSIO 61187]
MGSGSTTARTSRLGGVPAALPASGPATGTQLGLALVADDRTAPRPVAVLPDVVHVPGWLGPAEQADLVAAFRRWAVPPAGLRHPRVPTGHLMTVQSVCLGWHWQPYAYSRTADDTDGAPVKPLPPDLAALARRAASETGVPGAAAFAPDAAIVNLYAPGAHLGLHQDGEEPSDAPVVTISLGDACTFRLAGTDRRTGPFTDVRLESGDLLVFGGRNRRIFHGVPKIVAGTGPPGLDLPPGRLSITVRETGFG